MIRLSRFALLVWGRGCSERARLYYGLRLRREQRRAVARASELVAK